MNEEACKACAAGKVSRTGSRSCIDCPAGKYIGASGGKTADVCTVMSYAPDRMTTCCVLADGVPMVSVAFNMLL